MMGKQAVISLLRFTSRVIHFPSLPYHTASSEPPVSHYARSLRRRLERGGMEKGSEERERQ